MRSIVSAALSVVLAVTMLGSPAVAKPSKYQPPTPQKDRVTPSHTVPPKASPPAATPSDPTPAPVWPKATVSEVELSSPRDVRLGIDPAFSVTGTVTLTAPSSGPARARVRMRDRAQTEAAGVKGVLLGVERADGVSAKSRMTVTLDYHGIAGAYGADWAPRLRFVQLPACALTTPHQPECRRTPLASTNNAATGSLSASVEVAGVQTLLAAEAGTSSGAGEYGATSLQPSATWTAGSSTGEFNWNYPLRTPPAAGGPAPKLALSYSSASVDGRMAASNNQPSWIGEGFEMWPGYIERRYKTCGDDMGNGANNTEKTADLCCGTANATPRYVISPTFWSTRRLASVTTKLWTGTASDYSPVTTWTLTHSTPDPGDGTRGGLRLDRISQTGHVRVTTTVPDVMFAYVQLNNRVDPHLTPDHSPPMNWFRLSQITSETGGRVEITYSAEDCVANSRMPNVNALDDNRLRCYPVKWLTGVYDATTGQILLYVNGVLEGTAPHTTPWNAGGPFVVGSGHWWGESYTPWHGEIDQVRVWQRSLTATELNFS